MTIPDQDTSCFKKLMKFTANRAVRQRAKYFVPKEKSKSHVSPDPELYCY